MCSALLERGSSQAACRARIPLRPIGFERTGASRGREICVTMHTVHAHPGFPAHRKTRRRNGRDECCRSDTPIALEDTAERTSGFVARLPTMKSRFARGLALALLFVLVPLAAARAAELREI